MLAYESTAKWSPADRTLIEIACTRSFDELLQVRKAYHARYKRSLEEDVAAHTKDDYRKVTNIFIGFNLGQWLLYDLQVFT